jgi:GNAT superfamily N-acetyltransferase
VGNLSLLLRRAGVDDHDAIIGLIEAAAVWLHEAKHTDQWAQPWRNGEDRSNRIMRDLTAGRTWMLEDRGVVAATITADRHDDPIWPAERQRELAVYVRRLGLSRDYAGRRLGASLLDWAGLTARRGYQAEWIRVDVWRTNRALHRYYRRQGFTPCGVSTDPDCPSGALFQKPTEPLADLPAAVFQLR